MGTPRKISISSSSFSSCSSSGTNNGFKTVLVHPQMNKSGSNLPYSCLSNIKTENGEDSTNIDDKTSRNVDKNVQVSTFAAVRCSVNTIPVGIVSEESDHGIMCSKPSNDHSNKIAADATTCSKSTDDRKRNERKDNIYISDVIAKIAASSNIRSRRKKRERTECTATPQHSAPPSTSNRISMINQAPTIVTASMSNHYVPPRLQIGIGSQKNKAFTRSKSNDKNFAGNSNGPKNKVSVHMLNSVGLECGDDGTLRLEHFDDDDSASMCANDVNNARPIKIEDETGKGISTVLNNHKLSMWTLEQHKAFSAAIFDIGLKNCSPSIIMENMRKQPRYITRERTKSHLQKYRQTKERSKGEFLKEYDTFFKSTEQAKSLLKSKISNKNFKRREPFPKAVLTTALEGKKPSKLLGGKAAALLSYSVLNDFSTSHGPDQLQYKAAKFSEFPSLTEEETRSSVGASLLQVKSLIDNMTDVLLKTRHGIKPFPVGRSGIGDDESVSSSLCSSDDGYSDEEEDNIEGSGTVDKNLLCKASIKDQETMAAPSAVPKHVGMFPIGAVPSGPAHPLYRAPPTAYPAPFPAQGAPPPVAAGFPPPQYPHAQPPFYGGAPPPPHLQPAVAPGFGAPAGFHHPQVHYSQDPRIHPYQQAPPAPVGSYPGVPPMQPNYYPGVPGYPAFYGSANESNLNAVANTAPTKYSSHYKPSGDVYINQSRHGGEEERQRTNVYDQQSPSYSNDGRSDRRVYDMSDSSTEKRRRRRSEKRSKHRRRDDHIEAAPLSIDTSDLRRSSDGNDFGDFLDRLSKVPSPSKSSQKSSSSPIQRSRHHGRHKSSPHQQQFDTAVESSSYVKNYGTPEGDQFSEGGVSSFASPYEASPVVRAPSERSQNQVHVDQQKHSNNTGQFWESPNLREAGYNQQQQQHSAGGVEFHHQPAQLDAFASGPEQRQRQNHHSYNGVDDQQHANSIYLKSAQSSPEDGSTPNYFFGE